METIFLVLIFNINPLLLLITVLVAATIVYFNISAGFQPIKRLVLYASLMLIFSELITVAFNSALYVFKDKMPAMEDLTAIFYISLALQMGGIALLFFAILSATKTATRIGIK